MEVIFIMCWKCFIKYKIFILISNIFENKATSAPQGFPDSSVGKESAYNAGDPGLIPGSGRSTEKGLATHSYILGLW